MDSPAAKPARTPLPDLADLLFLGILSLIVWSSPSFLFADGSTGWHLATGHYILDHQVVPHTDLISYTFPDRPWVPYEWLWDVFAAMLENLGGLNLLAVTCSTIIAGLFACLYKDMRREGLHFALAAVIALVGSLVSSIHWLARPLLVTWVGLYIFNRTLVKFVRGETSGKSLWLICGLTMLVWVNSHPAFLLGFALFVIYSSGELITSLISADRDVAAIHRKRSLQLLIGIAILALCSLINPNGLQLFSYISHYLQQSAILEVTDEFNSPVFHGAVYATGLELLFLAVFFGLATSKKRVPLGELLVVMAFGHLALNAKRNDPLFAIVALPLIGTLLANSSFFLALSEKPDLATGMRDWLKPLRNLWQSLAATTNEVEATCNMHLLPIIIVIGLCFSAIGVQQQIHLIPSFVDAGFDAKDKPTATLAYIKQHNLDPKKGFNLDNWGGYIRYKTGNRVFIDDRSDFYGQEFFQKYGQIAEVHKGWDKALDGFNVEWILFPRNSYLALALIDQEKSGKAKFYKAAEDPAAYLFIRKRMP
jgi:hypothetical protein